MMKLENLEQHPGNHAQLERRNDTTKVSRLLLRAVWIILPVGTVAISVFLAVRYYRWSRVAEIPETPFPGNTELLAAVKPPAELNAADFYRLAIDLARQPLAVALNLPLSTSSTSETEELEAQRRRLVCDLVAKAASLPFALFYPPQDMDMETMLPECDNAHPLLTMLLDEAQRCRDDGQPGDALKLYLATIQMARHMEVKACLIFRNWAETRIEGPSLDAIVEWSKDDQVDESLLAAALQRLAELDRQVPSYEETVLVSGWSLSQYFSGTDFYNENVYALKDPNYPSLAVALNLPHDGRFRAHQPFWLDSLPVSWQQWLRADQQRVVNTYHLLLANELAAARLPAWERPQANEVGVYATP